MYHLLLNTQAPESYRQAEYNEKVDVFSFGMIMFELLMYELTYYALQCRDQVTDLITYVEGVCVDGDRYVVCVVLLFCCTMHGSSLLLFSSLLSTSSYQPHNTHNVHTMLSTMSTQWYHHPQA